MPRPRLLAALPEEAGYVLRLEAPFGYGKSVLLDQAAVHLHDLGFRVLRAAGPSLLPELERALGLPPGHGWPPVLARLEDRGAALLLDDLSDHSDLGPLLLAVPGPLVLASRRALSAPELLAMQTSGRLSSLYAAHLAFTPAEAQALSGDPGHGEALHADTHGWPLALHLGVIGQTGAEPALRRGLEGSLDAAQLAELRVNCALDGLEGLPAHHGAPHDLPRRPSPLLRRLFGAGSQTQAAVRDWLRQAPAAVRGAAYERLGWKGDLAALLEHSPGLGQQEPAGVLRWDALLPPGGPARALEVAWASVRSGALREGAAQFRRVAADPRATLQQRLDALGNAAFYLASSDLDAAQALLEDAEALWPQIETDASTEQVAQFLNRAAHVDYLAGNLPRGVARLTQALERLPVRPRTRLRSNVAVNLAMQRWWLDGDSDAHLAVRERELLAWGDDLPAAIRLSHRWNLGVTALLGGLPGEAIRHFQAALPDRAAHPLSALLCRCFLTLLRGDLDGLPTLWAEVQSYADPDTEDQVLCLWALELLRQGRAAEALRRVSGQGGALVETVRALVLQRAGFGAEALAALPAVTEPSIDREKALYVRATRYRVTRDEAELDALIRINAEGARVLASFVPASELPRSRPDLSVHHPLPEVLALGWKAAAALRLDELPPLDLRLLGGLELRVLGQATALSGRPRALLVLTALGHPREAVAEAIWPDALPEKSRNNLHVNLNLLRKVLEPWGVSTYLHEDGLRRTTCDLWRLQDALRRGDWETVRREYRPLVPDMPLPAVAEARERLHEQVTSGALTHAATLPPERAQDWLEWLLTLDPLNERALERLLRLLLAAGRRLSAERRYREYAGRLVRELGLSPSPALSRLLTTG